MDSVSFGVSALAGLEGASCTPNALGLVEKQLKAIN
jgi:hypothetical protein